MRSQEKNEGLSKLLGGGGMERGAKETSPSHSIGLQALEVFPFLSIGLQTLETYPSLSIGHQAWNIPLATELWIYLHFPSPFL
jgi:hypothetical protein